MVDVTETALKVSGLNTFYGKKQILKQVSLELKRGEIVAVIGHNGSGKSTLLKSIFGIIPFESGHINVFDEPLEFPSPMECLKRGLAYLPQDDPIFNSLTVEENLRISHGDGVANVITGFMTGPDETWTPWLQKFAKRSVRNLSGGEKKRVALSSILMESAKILLLDEPTAGLDFSKAKSILKTIKHYSMSNSLSVLLVEQNVRQALETAERAIILRRGEVAYSGDAKSILKTHRLKDEYL